MNLGKSLIEKIPVPVRELGMKVISLLPEGGRHSDILKSINTSILLFDNVLIMLQFVADLPSRRFDVEDVVHIV